MYQVLLVIHVITAISLVAFILLQQGRGAQTGASFGSGASNTVFGSQGSAGFLSRTTWYLVFIFFAVNLGLAVLTNKLAKGTEIEGPYISDEIPQETSELPANESDIPGS